MDVPIARIAHQRHPEQGPKYAQQKTNENTSGCAHFSCHNSHPLIVAIHTGYRLREGHDLWYLLQRKVRIRESSITSITSHNYNMGILGIHGLVHVGLWVLLELYLLDGRLVVTGWSVRLHAHLTLIVSIWIRGIAWVLEGDYQYSYRYSLYYIYTYMMYI